MTALNAKILGEKKLLVLNILGLVVVPVLV